MPAVLEAHLHPVCLGHQELGRRCHWLGCLVRLRHHGGRGPLTLDQRGADLLGVGAHRLDPEPDASQTLEPFRRLLEGQLSPGLGHPRL